VTGIPGLGEHEDVIGWTEDGKSLSIWNQEIPAKVWTLDLDTSKRKLVQSIDPAMGMGAMYARVLTCADGSVAAYRLRRGMYSLYLAEGLR
jgi:hypothetical protein